MSDFFGEDFQVGQTWKRRDGSTFVIDHFTPGYAHYWLARGSRPQFRSVRLDLLKTAYAIVSPDTPNPPQRPDATGDRGLGPIQMEGE